MGQSDVLRAAFGITEAFPTQNEYAFGASFSYDTNRTDMENTDPDRGRYFDPIQSMVIYLDGHSFTVPITMSDILISAGSGQPHSFLFSTYGTIDVLGKEVTILTLGQITADNNMTGEPNPYYTSDALQPPPFHLNTSPLYPSTFHLSISGWRFPVPGGGMPYDIDQASGFNGVIRSVPEPSSWLLLGGGLAWLISLRKKTR